MENNTLAEKWAVTGLLEVFEKDEHKQVAAHVLENAALEMLAWNEAVPQGDKQTAVRCLFPIIIKTLVPVFEFVQENKLKIVLNQTLLDENPKSFEEVVLAGFPTAEGVSEAGEVDHVNEATAFLTKHYIKELVGSKIMFLDTLLAVKSDADGNLTYVTKVEMA